MKSRIIKALQTTWQSLFIALLIITSYQGRALAVFNEQTPWYNPDATCSGAGNSIIPGLGESGPSPAGDGKIIWRSGINGPPFILEQMMIEALKDIAQKNNIPLTDILTENHVIALVGFANGEGGDINNNDIWNPLNSGISDSDLRNNSPHAGDGKQSFKSFDAGVEAIARNFSHKDKSRLIQVLRQKDSTPQQFIYALTYFQKYPGNTIWAAGSDPAYHNQGQAGQDAYYRSKLDATQRAANHWADVAGLVIGTSAQEQDIHLTHPELLQYHPAGNVSYSPESGGNISSGVNCACTPSGDPTTTTDGKNTVVLDPGHSGKTDYTPDPITGILDRENHNVPETEDVFAVAQLAKAKLQQDGYTVLMTKANAKDVATKRQRVDVANNANAAIAVSIHTQANIGFNDGNNDVYVQRVGQWRTKLPPGKPGYSNGDRITFPDAKLGETAQEAELSQKYGDIMAKARTTAEGHSVTVKQDASGGINGGRGGDIPDGNIWVTQLLSKVPWIYEEIGGKSAKMISGLNPTDQQKYANGIVAGIEQAIPLDKSGGGQTTATPTTTPTSSTDCASGGVVAGNIAQTAINLAWTDGSHGLTPKPEYIDALRKYDPQGEGSSGGADCGAFVSTVMRASGADPNYPPLTTSVMIDYLKSHPDLYQPIAATTSADLQPGDILIVDKGGGIKFGHTYIFVGLQPNGFDQASASKGDRMPNLGKTQLVDKQRGPYMIFRIKAGA